MSTHKSTTIVRKTLTAIILAGLFVAVSGCGTTKGQVATEQMVVSDAVDRSIANIDFRPLSGKRVFLDTQFMKAVPGIGFVNTDYIISSLRQQMVAASCLLEDDKASAEFVVEARVGALGTDKHDVTYGIPASSSLSNAAALMPNAPPIPVIPEIAIAKRNDQVGAAKIAVFAYNRETRVPVWQSGIAKARSTSKDIWLFGAGPFQRGSVHKGTQFAGESLNLPLLTAGADNSHPDPMTMYNREVHFVQTPPTVPEKTEPAGTPAQTASFSKEKPPAEKTAANPQSPTEKK